MIENPLVLTTVIIAITGLGLWLDRHVRWAGKIGAALLIVGFGAVLSNTGLVPVDSPVYAALSGPVTSLAIVWLLLAVDLRDLKTAGPVMLGAFALAAAGTALGAIVATQVFGGGFPDDQWKLAGVMTGTYSGGSLNFVSVGRELDLPPALYAAATAADNVVTALWIGATLMLPVWLKRVWPANVRAIAAAKDTAATGPEHHPIFSPVAIGVIDLAMLLLIGFGLLAASEYAASWVPSVPAVLWFTTMALIVAQLPPVRRLSGALQLGTFALHAFFALIGIWSNIAEIFKVGIEVFYFTVTVVAVHGLVTYGAARLLRLELHTTSVASQAAIGGPSTAMALAVALERNHLALPGLMAGLLGYGVGTYAGFAVAYIMRATVGG